MTNLNADGKALEDKLKAATEKARLQTHIPAKSVPGQQLARKNAPPIPDPREQRG